MIKEDGKQPQEVHHFQISPKSTLREVKSQLCTVFKIDESEPTQLWMRDQLIDEE